MSPDLITSGILHNTYTHLAMSISGRQFFGFFFRDRLTQREKERERERLKTICALLGKDRKYRNVSTSNIVMSGLKIEMLFLRCSIHNMCR